LWKNTTQSQGQLQESTGENTAAQTKDKQTKNEVMMMMMIIIIIIIITTVIAYYVTSWTNTI
jgi:heme/copper-type cytochrome/quinol oxidase subunit 2